MAPIKGVTIRPLRRISDARGSVMHMLRRDDPAFEKFGEIYFSTVNPGYVKGWHLHTKMTLNYAVPHGRIRLALYDQRPGSPTKGRLQVVELGGRDYALATVPPGVWNGFKGLGRLPALVANCATLAHDPAEIKRLDPFKNDIPYSWGRCKGGA